MARVKPETWRCEHRYPILVEKAGGAEQAMVALRAEARAGQRLGA